MDNKKLIEKLKQLPRNDVFPIDYGGLQCAMDEDGDYVHWDDIEQLIEELEQEIKPCDK